MTVHDIYKDKTPHVVAKDGDRLLVRVPECSCACQGACTAQEDFLTYLRLVPGKGGAPVVESSPMTRVRGWSSGSVFPLGNGLFEWAGVRPDLRLEKAIGLAKYAHGAIDQRRKYTNDPYIVHPEAVAKLVASVPHTFEMLSAAWLHDTIEDAGMSDITIEAECGATIAMYVRMLTDVSQPEDGNRAKRKAKDLAHLAKACPEAKTIKLADLLDNSKSILAHDPEFARVYLQEKRALLEVLRDGDSTLYAEADRVVREGLQSLGLGEGG
jgi:hypothetical protein